jgi:hypothetical protein
MTITKTLKTKLVLGILAAAASLTLVVGGTLMLFTAESGTATNVVTLGKAKIQIEESQGGDYNLVVGELDFGDKVLPGDSITKRPRVANTGDTDVYLYVDGLLKITNSYGDPIDLTNDANANFREYALAILNEMKAEDLGADWKGASTTVTKEGISGRYYYVNEEDTSSLKILQKDDETSDIFTTVDIPTSIKSDLSGYTIKLDLKAYAVQAKNSDGKELIDDASIDNIANLFAENNQ